MDEDLKLVDQLLFEATRGYMTSVARDVMAKAAATITRLHATITQMTNAIDGLEFQLNEARAEIEALKSDVSDLVRAGSDEATENERLREALTPFADAYAALKRSGYLVAPNGTALMYDPQDPKLLGPFVEDLARASRTLDGE